MKRQSYKIKVKTYCINKGTPSQYFGLKNAEENQVLRFAPNNWKTERGALNWAKKHGFEVASGRTPKNITVEKLAKPTVKKPAKGKPAKDKPAKQTPKNKAKKSGTRKTAKKK